MKRFAALAVVLGLAVAMLFSVSPAGADPGDRPVPKTELKAPSYVAYSPADQKSCAGVWVNAAAENGGPNRFATVYFSPDSGPVIALADYRKNPRYEGGHGYAVFLDNGVPTMQVSKPGKPTLFVDLYDFAEAINAAKKAKEPAAPKKVSSAEKYDLPKGFVFPPGTPSNIDLRGHNADDLRFLFSPMNNQGTFEPLVFATRQAVLDNPGVEPKK